MPLSDIDTLVSQLKKHPLKLRATTLQRTDDYFELLRLTKSTEQTNTYIRRYLFCLLYEPYTLTHNVFHEKEGLAELIGAMDFWTLLIFDSDRWLTIKEQVKVDLDRAHDYELRLASQDDFLETIQQILVTRKKKFYEECQKRMDVLRQDLIAEAWHPRRVEKWLEIGGFELLETL